MSNTMFVTPMLLQRRKNALVITLHFPLLVINKFSSLKQCNIAYTCCELVFSNSINKKNVAFTPTGLRRQSQHKFNFTENYHIKLNIPTIIRWKRCCQHRFLIYKSNMRRILKYFKSFITPTVSYGIYLMCWVKQKLYHSKN